MEEPNGCTPSNLLSFQCDASLSSSSLPSSNVLMETLLGNEIRNMITLELAQNNMLMGLTASDDFHKSLGDFKSHPSYQDLLNKLKDRTKSILRALDHRKLNFVKQVLHGLQNELPSVVSDEKPDAATKLTEKCCFGGTAMDNDDDGEDITSSGSSESSPASQDSSLTLRACSPHRKQCTPEVEKQHCSIAENQTLDRFGESQNAARNPIPGLNERTSEKFQATVSQHRRHQQYARRALPPQMSQSFSDADSSFSSCFNQSGFTVLNQDQLVTLAVALDPHRSPLVSRQQALRHLVHLPIIDIQACEAWSAPGMPHDQQTALCESSIRGADGSVGTTSLHRLDQTEQTTTQDWTTTSLRRWTRVESDQTSGLPAANLRTGLADALNDTDETLWSLAMRYISKGLSTTPPNILETYSLLMEHLNYQFETCGRKLPLVREGVDIARYPVDRLVRALHLMNQFHRTITHYWIRHSEKFLSEIITRCVSLLSINCPDSVDSDANGRRAGDTLCRLSPIHLLSLIDPRASWFIKWMHGTYSRIPLVDRLKRTKKMITLILSVLCRFLRKNTKPNTPTVPLDCKDTNKSAYSEAELEYALFLHSVSMLRHLLCHAAGRSVFESQAPSSSDTPTSIKSIICMMAQYLQNHSPSTQSNNFGSIPFEMVASCLTELAGQPGCCELFFTSRGSFAKRTGDSIQPLDALINGLLELFDIKNTASIRTAQLDRSLKAETYTSILRKFASHHAGRRVLHAYALAMNRDETFIDRMQRIIREELSSRSARVSSKFPLPLSSFVIGLIDLCGSLNTFQSNRSLHSVAQIYHTIVYSWNAFLSSGCDGLVDARANFTTDSPDRIMLLKRNLMQVAQSTLGVVVLERAELLADCAQILHTVHKDRLKCTLIQSHFWGLILTQMSSRATGSRALRNSGLVQRLVTEAWKAVEFPTYVTASDCMDKSMNHRGMLTCITQAVSHTPPIWPIDPIDNGAYKPFINLVKLTSSFEAMVYFSIYEGLEHGSTKTAMPESLLDLIDRSVLIDCDEKMRSLYNLEQTHVFGLRLLSCIISDLDCMLLLCTRLDLLRILTRLQLDTFAQNEQGAISLDALVLERNYLLVKCYFCGGPTERRLPNRFICEHKSNGYPNPIITRPPHVDDPATHDYHTHASLRKSHCDRLPCTSWYENLFAGKTLRPIHNRSGSRLTQALQKQITSNMQKPVDSTELSAQWIAHCQRILRTLAAGDSTKFEWSDEEINFGAILQHCLRARQSATGLSDQTASDTLADASDPEFIRSMDLSPFEVLGVETAVRYGQRIGALAHDSLHPLTDSGHVAALANLIKRVRWGLQTRQHSSTDSRPGTSCSEINIEHETAHGFDWFTATIFLAFRGDANHAWNFLSQFAADPLSVYLWPYRAQFECIQSAAGHNPNALPLHMTGHYFDHILALECPNIYNTFVLAELPPSQIAQRWMKQCFWNYLDWGGIMDYLVLCLIHVQPYQMYFILAVFRHLRRAIRMATTQSPTDQQQQPQQLVVFLQEEPIRNFDSLEHLDFMHKLHETYSAQWIQAVVEHANCNGFPSTANFPTAT